MSNADGGCVNIPTLPLSVVHFGHTVARTHSRGSNACMVDGSIRTFRRGTDALVITRLVTRASGEPAGDAEQ